MAGLLANLLTKRWTLSDLMNIDSSRQQKSSGCSTILQETYIEIKSEGIIDKFKRFFTRNKSVMNVMFVIFKFNVNHKKSMAKLKGNVSMQSVKK